MNTRTFAALYNSDGQLKKKTYDIKDIANEAIKDVTIKKEVEKALKEQENKIISGILKEILDYTDRFEEYIRSNKSYSIWDFDAYKQSISAFYDSIFVVSNSANVLNKLEKYIRYNRQNWQDLQEIMEAVESIAQRESNQLNRTIRMNQKR